MASVLASTTGTWGAMAPQLSTTPVLYVAPKAGTKKPESSREPPDTPVKKTFVESKETSLESCCVIKVFTAAACGTPSVRLRPDPPPQKRFGSGARTTTPMRLLCTAWLGKSKNEVPPSPWRRTFRPAAAVLLVVVFEAPAPGTPDAAVKAFAGALILYRMESPLFSLG